MSAIVPQDNDIIDVVDQFPIPSAAKRQIADLINRIGENEIIAEAMNRRVTQKEYMVTMLWDLITYGNFHFADGTEVGIEDLDQWLGVVKFVANHLDGSAGRDISMSANIFKIYQGVDVDQV